MRLLRKFSKRHYFRQITAYVLMCCMFFNTSLSVALAGPEGAQVVNGQVTLQQSGYNTTITASDRSIINYSSFDIARPEIVEFIQPSSSASVLNRILSANPTNINGTLLANGRVFFVNPAGVYIGAGARINVNQLVASALNISNSDFINGRYNFAGGNGSVINTGDILAEKVYLIGRHVANSGNISCPSGYVVMAAGDRVFLGEPGSDIVLEIEATSLPELTAPINSEPAVLNEGTVAAAGGTIVLAAEGDIYSQAISNVGSLSVSVETDDAGQIKLIAPHGQIVNAGTIEASGDAGGTVTIDGGDVVLAADSIIHADAIGVGDGGEILVYADTLDIGGVFTAQGQHGHVLLDPAILNIDTPAKADAIVDALDLTPTVDLEAEQEINVSVVIDSSAQTNDHTLNFKDENIDGLEELTINLNETITIGDNQTLTGDGTTVNVLSEDASIQNGIDVSASGATITVANGTYNENLTVNKSDLTLKSKLGEDVTLNANSDNVVDLVSGADGFTLGGADGEGFTINSGGGAARLVQITHGSPDVEISWNTLDTTGSASMGINIGAAGATGLNINENTFIAEEATVSDNTFTGPGGFVSGYAMQFKAATGASTITGNTITGYGWGVGVLSGGGGTSGLTISDNSISDCITGIGLVQYQAGDITTVAITSNTLSNNTTGVKIYDGANVKASNFTIQGNSLSGNTTGLANNHTSESVTATQNYWGDVDGPSGIGPGSGDPITEAVADSVDYSPWWGGDYIGDSHMTAWTWGTDDSIQDAIDLASTTVSDRIYVTSGIYSEMVNVNKQLEGLYFRGDGTVASEIDGTLTLSDAVASNTGVGIYTQNNGDLILNTVSDTGVHSLLVDTGDGTLSLDENVTANSGITLDGGIINAGNDASDKITSAGAVSITGTGTVTINAEIDPGYVDIQSDDILVNALITAADWITLIAGTDGTGSVTVDHTGSNTGSLQTTAAGSDITVTAGTSDPGGSGNISLLSDALGDAKIETQGGTGDGHEITLTAWDGAIAMDDGSLIDAGDGKIDMKATGGNITLGGLLTTSNLADAVTIDTSAAVVDGGDSHDDIVTGATGTLVIDAVTGIGGDGVGNEIETDADTLYASVSGTGDIDITEVDGIELVDVDTFDGDICITSGGQMTATDVQAGGSGEVELTTVSGDVLVDDVKALGNTIMIDSAGWIEEKTDVGDDLTADILNLDAETGIGASNALETSATTISADTTDGDIDIDNTHASNVTASSLTTGTGDILFSQDGDGALDVTWATTSDGSIGIDVDNANLTAGTITAGGAGDVVFTTTTSGNVLVDNVTAADDQITINSDGAITESGMGDAAADL
ncbi:MAG: beta strand repeat-containing protein, partial [Planctomycetota bacterium]